MADTATKLQFCSGLAKFIDNAGLADFTILCNGTQWKVHRLLLAAHSSVLGKACEGDVKETKDGQLDLSEYRKEQVGALVEYLYRFDYGTVSEDVSVMLFFHVNMCIMGDKYDIEGLKNLSIKKFENDIKETVESSELVGASYIAYESASATERICRSLVDIIVEKGFMSKPSIERTELDNVLRNYPDLAIQIIEKFSGVNKIDGHGETIAVHTFMCPNAKCRKNMSSHIQNKKGLLYTCSFCRMTYSGAKWHNTVVA